MDWRSIAMCRSTDPDLFFPVGSGDSGLTLEQTQEAKAVCHRCPVRQRCLEWALVADPVEGIWGGTTEQERRAVRRRAVRLSRDRAETPAA